MPRNSPTAAVLRQLSMPDRDSRDVALLRTRLYRFSDDPRCYALAEALEERLLADRALWPASLTFVRHVLAAIRATGRPLPFDPDVAFSEGIDVTAELAARVPFGWQQTPRSAALPSLVVIVGAPRSGTSHLFNLLAWTGQFAYFTTASCWAWPVRNLHHPGRRLFTAWGDTVADAVFAVDNRSTRVIPGLVMPGEAEDIWARAIPAYRHIAGHQYELTPARTWQPEILKAAARAHSAYLSKRIVLAKSPFCSFRIPQTEALWAGDVRWIHIIRDRRQAAESMRRNRFEFRHEGRRLTAEQAWHVFVAAVGEHAPADRLTTVTHRELLADPARMAARIINWLGLDDRHRMSTRNGAAPRRAGGPGVGTCPLARPEDQSREDRNHRHGTRRHRDV